MKKTMFLFSILIVILLFQSQTAEAKKSSYITNKKYAGTYGVKGQKNSYENGWYSIIISKISASGKMRFAVERAGRNASPIYATGALKAVIRGNKAKFTYEEDGWGNKGKGTIIFKKNGDLYVKIKETYTAASNRSTLETPKVVFKKKSNNHKIM